MDNVLVFFMTCLAYYPAFYVLITISLFPPPPPSPVSRRSLCGQCVSFFHDMPSLLLSLLCIDNDIVVSPLPPLFFFQAEPLWTMCYFFNDMPSLLPSLLCIDNDIIVPPPPPSPVSRRSLCGQCVSFF